MRMALVTQWLRVARHFPELRARCLRYAVGITLLQLLWLLIIAVPEQYAPWLFAVLAIGELSIPQWAEGAARGSRYWRLFHPEHIEERYGLFTIIVLGESVLSATVGIQEVATRGVSADLIVVAAGGLLIAFGAWWIYFDHPGHLTPNPALSMRWGYLHVVVFVSLAALGAGLHVAAEAVAGEASDAHRRARRRHPRRRLPRRHRAADGRHPPRARARSTSCPKLVGAARDPRSSGSSDRWSVTVLVARRRDGRDGGDHDRRRSRTTVGSH